MASVAQLVSIISNRSGIAESVVSQAARRLREDELLPNSSGSSHSQCTPEHVALLIFASLTTPTANAATRTALCYANLTLYGEAKPDEATTLLRHFSTIIKTAWHGKTANLSFVSLTLDMMKFGASTVMQTRVGGEGLTCNFTFVRPDNDPDIFRAQTVRREITLTAEVFQNIIADIRHVDEGIRRRRIPFTVTKIGRRNVGR